MAESNQSVLASGHPPETIPTIYADGIANILPTTEVVKFYLFRLDPNQSGVGEVQPRAIAQVILPMSGFLRAAFFFERAIKHFLNQGTLAQEIYDAIKKVEGG